MENISKTSGLDFDNEEDFNEWLNSITGTISITYGEDGLPTRLSSEGIKRNDAIAIASFQWKQQKEDLEETLKSVDWPSLYAGGPRRGPQPQPIDWELVERQHLDGQSLEDIAVSLGISRRQFMTRWSTYRRERNQL